MSVGAVNDAPSLSATALDPAFTEAAGLGTQAAPSPSSAAPATSTIESGQTITGLTFTVSGLVDGADEVIVVDGTSLTLGVTSSGTTTTNGLTYNATVSGGTATIVLSGGTLSAAATQTLVDGIAYQNTNTDDPTRRQPRRHADADRRQRRRQRHHGTVDRLDGGGRRRQRRAEPERHGAGPGFTEAAGLGTQAGAVNVFGSPQPAAIESGQTITGLTLTVSGLVDGVDEVLVVDGTSLALGGSSSGTTTTNGLTFTSTVSGGTATIVLSGGTLSAAATQALVDGITYQNTSTDDPTAGNRVVTLTQVVDSGGGSDTTALAIGSTVTVSAVNDAPTLTATALNPTFAEAAGLGTQAGAIAVFGSTAASTVEAGQTVSGLTFTVSGLLDGADEAIVVDGTTITLGVTSAGTTAGNGLSYNATVSGGTATIVLSGGTLSAAATQTLVDGITYQNTNTDDPTAGNRVVTLTQVVDSGGGSDTTALAIASTVLVSAVNDVPTLTATALNPSFTEGAGAVNVFGSSAASTIESGQAITGLTLTVAGLLDGADEVIVVDGNTIALGANTSGTTTTNGLSFTATVSGGTATIVLSGGAMNAAATQSLVDAIAYQNTNTDDPTAGNRVVTLTQIVDSGGGIDTAVLAIASTVTVGAVNDAPVLSDTALSLTVVEDAGAPSWVVGSPISAFTGGITDVDGASVRGIAVVGSDQTNGTWYYTINGGANWIALGVVDATQSLLLADNASTRLYFEPAADYAGAVTSALTLRAWDQTSGVVGTKVSTALTGNATAFSTATDVIDVTVTAVNDAPVLASLEGLPLTFTENGAALPVTATLTVGDVDHATLTGATVRIGSNYAGAEDLLAFTNTAAITGSWDASSGILTLSGVASVADYQAALRAVTYVNTSDDPSTLARTVTFVVNDGSADSNLAGRTINVVSVNDAPVITSGGGGPAAGINVNENATAVTTLTATDVDAGTTLSYAIIGGTDATRFTIDAASGALTFLVAPNFEAPTDAGGDNVYEVVVQVSDGSLADVQAISITVANVNETPTITSDGAGPTAARSVSENSTLVTTVTAIDEDAGTMLTYSISGGVDAARFSIDGATGALSFVVAPAFGSPTDVGGDNVYEVVAQVSDGVLVNTQAIAVSVTSLGSVPADTNGNTGPDPLRSALGNKTAASSAPPAASEGVEAIEAEAAPATAAAPGREGSGDAALGLGAPRGAELARPAAPLQASAPYLQRETHAPRDLQAKSMFDFDLSIASEQYLLRVSLTEPYLVLAAGDGSLRIGAAAGPTEEGPAANDGAGSTAPIVVQAAQATGVALTVGTVWWALRAGGLLASLIGSLPAWRQVDVLAVLPDDEDKEEWSPDGDAEDMRDERAVDAVLGQLPEGEDA